MLKFEGKFPNGTHVRAYDFEPLRGRMDSYIEGILNGEFTDENGVKFLLVECTHDVHGGKQYLDRVGYTVRVPMETSMDYDHRIIEV